MQSRPSVFRGLALLGAVAMGITACEPKTEVILPTPQPEIVLTEQSITLNVGESRQLAASVRNVPAGQPSTVTCTVASEAPGDVVDVSAGCLVTAVSVGTALVTVTSATTPSVTAQVAINVVAGGGQGGQITLTPQNVPSLPVGDSVVLVTTGVPAGQEVTFTSSDPSRATVTRAADGNNAIVRGVAPGTAVITARVGENGPVATSTITVVAAGGVGNAAISIAEITQITTVGARTPINPNNVFGNIEVTINAIPGNADSLQVLLINQTTGDTLRAEGCGRSFGGSSDQQQTITCTINTAAAAFNADTTAAVPQFANAQYRVVARLVEGNDVLDAASEPLTFNNVDAIVGRILTDTSAIGAEGLLWQGGDVVLRAIPLIFSQNTGNLASVTASMTGFYQGAPVVVTATDTDPSDGFRLVFDASEIPPRGGISGFITDPDGTTITASSVTEGGQAGPTGNTFTFTFADLQSGTPQPNAVLRIDNQDPVPAGATNTQVTLTLPGSDPEGGFVSGASQFRQGIITSELDPATGTFVAQRAGTLPSDAPFGMQGVDRVTVSFAAVAAGLVGANTTAENARLFGIGTPVVTGANLEGTNENTAIVLIAQLSDALGNVSFVRLNRPTTTPGVFAQTFGVDLAAPTILFSTAPANPSVPDSAIIRAAAPNFVVSFTDVAETAAQGGPSGFGPTPIQVQLIRFAADAPNGECYALVNPDGDNIFNGVNTGGGRGTAPNCTFYPTNGVVDVPGAAGYYMFMAFTRDRAGNVSDTITSIVLRDGGFTDVAISGQSLFNNQLRLTGTLVDNVDLGSYDMRLRFAGLPVPGAAMDSDLPFTQMLQIGMFGMPLNISQTVDQTMQQIIRGIQMTGAGDAPAATIYPVTAAGFGAVDVSGLYSENFTNVSAPSTSNGIPAALTSFNVNVLPAGGPTDVVNICNNVVLTGCGNPAVPTTRNLAATATGPTNTFQRPFARVYFYYVNPVMAGFENQNQVYLIGSTDVAVATEVTAPTTARSWTYNIPFSAVGLPNPTDAMGNGTNPNVTIFAVGVDADGDALMTQINQRLRVIGVPTTMPQ